MPLNNLSIVHAAMESETSPLSSYKTTLIKVLKVTTGLGIIAFSIAQGLHYLETRRMLAQAQNFAANTFNTTLDTENCAIINQLIDCTTFKASRLQDSRPIKFDFKTEKSLSRHWENIQRVFSSTPLIDQISVSIKLDAPRSVFKSFFEDRTENGFMDGPGFYNEFNKTVIFLG